jgi:DNA polymerase
MHDDAPILLDVESVSRADLTECGGRNYWEHPSTRPLCVVLHDMRDGTRSLWLPGDPPPALEGRELGAHNWSGFDRFAVARLGWRPLTYATGVDTSELARMHGLPGALDALAKRWQGREKDHAASRFTVALSQCRRPAGKGPNRISPEDWRELNAAQKRALGVQPTVSADDLARVVAYCDLDVDIMAAAWPRLAEWLAVDADVRAADRAINDRGVLFDVQLAARLLECDARAAERACADAARELGAGWTPALVREVAGSPEQFAHVTGLPDATKGTLDAYDGTTWAPLVRARRALASIARGKLEAGRARVSPDGRLRDSHRYVGAHPWRWAGKGLQTQNMPRPAKRFETWGDAEICRAADAVLAGGDADAELIDVLLRACLMAPAGKSLAVCDYSGVEARALAWQAGDADAIAALLSATGPYRNMAGVIYGDDPATIGKGDPKYSVGKISELACGYQGSVGAFTKMAKTQSVSLDGVDVPEVVAAWRRAHAPTVQFWYALERAFIRAANGCEARVGVGCEFTIEGEGNDVAIYLPNGRPIVYNDVRLRRDERGRVKVSYAPMYPGPGTYIDARDGTLRADTYGGKLTQNVTEGVCRELLAGALVAAESAGLAPALHVHDEAVCEVDRGEEGLADIRRIMLTLPEWASTFPAGAAGHHGRRYRK